MSPKKPDDRHVEFDQVKIMPRDQLETAWLGSIFTRPQVCRNHGLAGLDQSMFHRHYVFQIGLELIRDQNFMGYTAPSSVLNEMIERRLISEILKAENELEFMPSLYRSYAEEIERRAEDGFKAAWTK